LEATLFRPTISLTGKETHAVDLGLIFYLVLPSWPFSLTPNPFKM
jgi:hypothetical protein